MNHLDHFEDLLSDVREYADHDLPYYASSLRSAFTQVEPLFTRSRYAEFFWHCASTVPGWLPKVVIANSEAESEGSAKLLKLWRTVSYNSEVEDKVLVHAKDESRHSRLFLCLAERAFPSWLVPGEIARLNDRLPDVRRKKYEKAEHQIPEALLIDHLVQMNIGEIRTRIHMHLLAPVIYAFTPKEYKDSVGRILEGLVRDEVRHIGYTALLMEKWAEDGAVDYLDRLYSERLHDFSLVTLRQTEPAIRSYGQGRFPDLLEI